jgi:hypothetical protein
MVSHSRRVRATSAHDGGDRAAPPLLAYGDSVQQSRKGSLRWGWVAAWFVLVTAVMAGAHWVLDRDAPWTDHLVVGALWGVSIVVLIWVLQRRRDSQG